jgi:hypothetical protein
MNDDVIAILLAEMLSEWSAASSSDRDEAIRQLHRLTNGPNPDDGIITEVEQLAIFAHLSRIIRKIEDPCQWTSKAFARDGDGEEVSWGSPGAICWDVYGAWHATKARSNEVGLDALLAPEIQGRYITAQELNDHGGHAKTLAVLRIARRRFMSPELALRILAVGSDF